MLIRRPRASARTDGSFSPKPSAPVSIIRLIWPASSANLLMAPGSSVLVDFRYRCLCTLDAYAYKVQCRRWRAIQRGGSVGEKGAVGAAAATLAARTYLDGERQNRPLSSSIVRGTVYTAPSVEEHARLYQQGARTFYQRFGHPGEEELAEKVAALEGAESALVFASGMAAISTSLLA